MALILRCPNCPPASAPDRASDLRRSPQALLSAPDLALREAPFRRQRIELFFTKTFGFHILSAKAKQLSIIQSLNSDYDAHECRCNHQVHFASQGMMGSSGMKALFVANASMLFLPFKAVAETCEGDQAFFNMPILFAIAFIGATVGGLLARQRKAELARLNDQLRQINAALRRQAKIESYAPQLSYAPVGRIAEADVIVDPRKEQLIAKLREGKKYLRIQNPDKAFQEFKAAFDIAISLGDHTEEKKAARGLGASLQRQGKYKDAIKYHSKVLEIAKRSGEEAGSTEAYGAIADCYTELGDLERAGKFYDKYIARLETD